MHESDTQITLVDASGIVTNDPGDACGGNFRPPKGDTLAIAATNMDSTGYSICEANTVSGGLVTCKADLEHFAFGAGSSTAGDWGGVDMRAEVAILDRSITIMAETDYIGQTDYTGSSIDSEPWGCRVLVADWIDNGHDLGATPPGGYAMRKGEVHMDYVEVKGCSQKGTWRAAV